MDEKNDVGQIEKAVDISNVYYRDEQLILESLKELFDNIKKECNSKFSSKLDNLQNDIFKNLKTISNNTYSEIMILDKVSKGYNDIRKYLAENDIPLATIRSNTNINFKSLGKF